MSGEITVRVDGRVVTVPGHATVAAAVALAGKTGRRSVTGEPRGPLCGMGTCFECRVQVDGVRHVRGCLTACRPSMEIRTDDDRA